MALALTRFTGQVTYFSAPTWDASLEIISIRNRTMNVLLDLSGKLSRWSMSDGESMAVGPETSVQFRIFNVKVRMAITAPKSVRVVREEAVETSMSL